MARLLLPSLGDRGGVAEPSCSQESAVLSRSAPASAERDP